MDHHPLAHVNAYMRSADFLIGSLKKIRSPGLASPDGIAGSICLSSSAVFLPTFHPLPQLLITQHTKPEQSKLVEGEEPPHT